MIKRIFAVILAAAAPAAIAACDVSTTVADDASRPSLFPHASPTGYAAPTGYIGSAGSVPVSQPERREGFGVPYPSQQRVLDQQRTLLNQDIRQQETSRDSLGQQLQQQRAREQSDLQQLQQQLQQERDRR